HLFGGDFGVVYDDIGLLAQQGVGHVDGRRLARVVGVLFEGPTQEGNLLARYRVVHSLHDVVGEAPFLVVVHGDDLLPVMGHLMQPVAAGDVHQVEDVLLETGAPETHRGLQELGADAAVGADGTGHLVHVGPRLFAQLGDGIDGGYPLGQERVGRELGQFGRPQVGGDYPLAWHP